MYSSAQVILLDEPTAALGPKETAAFTRVVREFVERRTTVLHGDPQPPAGDGFADRIVVMRAGRVVATMNVSDVTEEQLLGLMVGSAAAV